MKLFVSGLKDSDDFQYSARSVLQESDSTTLPVSFASLALLGGLFLSFLSSFIVDVLLYFAARSAGFCMRNTQF